MNDFDFYNPVRILFGKERLPELKDLVPRNKKIMMIYGGGSIKKNGVYKRVKNALENHTVVEFGGIEPNPTHEKAMEAVEVLIKEQCSFILAVGGGSVIDAAKYIAAAVCYDGDPWEILTDGAEIRRALPLGVVLTLPATGTEMNANSVISRKSTEEKLSFGDTSVMPVFSILEPDAAASLPARQVANGIVDSFVHVIEQYLTYPVNAPLQDRISEAILQTLIEVGPKVYKNPADYDAMANLMWCSTMALNGLISRGVPEDWSVHTIGHELTALHGIDHARTLAIVLPGLWTVFKEKKFDKLLQYGRRVWKIDHLSDQETVDAAIGKTIDFFESLGVKTRLGNYNVGKTTIDIISERLEKRGLHHFGDRDMVSPEKTREILHCRL